MCTVTYIPLKKGAVLTSNRDEHISRGHALYPDFHLMNEKRLAFPRDPQTGGTWFICNEQGDAGILLNGAFTRHKRKLPYRKSRGWVLPEIFQHASPMDALRAYPLRGIEPFTIVLFASGRLMECRWDGNRLSEKQMDHTEPHIWSSVTLYADEMIRERHGWFNEWLQQQDAITQEDILDFHMHTKNGNREYGLLIARDNDVSTGSISSIRLEPPEASFFHKDMLRKVETVLEFELLSETAFSSPGNRQS